MSSSISLFLLLMKALKKKCWTCSSLEQDVVNSNVIYLSVCFTCLYHTSLSSGKGVETALLMQIQGQRTHWNWNRQRGRFYPGGDGEWGVLGRGAVQGTRFSLPSGARLWVGSTGPEDSDQFGFVCFCIYLHSFVISGFGVSSLGLRD